ncbi:cytochrome-c peroxidase [Flavobacterium sp. 7A]|uniref:cytochrome-c peroxidase n=1 Tax=Flavobacterium sp. 7A TaxID=2940571 RepID=UPI002225F6CE|nr:cytochrome c peroxidase [Flavobacterium sp. 7A]MCW2118719.1 cytochrome c peroxidase [Flavobacterium sp. 7A]
MKFKILFFVLLLTVVSCTDNDDNEYQDIPLAFQIPSNFPALAYNISLNPPTEKGFELGKKLFYDGRLSSDGLISCGFCHEQATAFTHHGHTFSHGVNNEIGTRNTPSIQNLAFQNIFMYDGAAPNLDVQPIIPLLSQIEMNGDLTTIMAMMKADADYKRLFKQAFENGEINAENMLKAMSQFMVMMMSSNSRFDKFRRNETGGAFTSDEQAGYTVFNAKCASCHATDLMTDHSFRNNGLALNPKINDVGRYRVTEIATDYYKFKVPSLRNVDKTAPYMHDGRFGTLDAVLDHYSSGVLLSATLDPLLNQNGKLGISLSTIEKDQLILFLKTLTDDQYLTDRRFGEN